MASLAPPCIPLQTHTFDSDSTQKRTEEWLFTSLKSPRTPTQLKSLHAHVIKTNLAQNDLVLGQLLLCSSLSDSTNYARRVFDSIPQPKPFFYNAMLKGYSQTGQPREAIRLYSLLRANSVASDSYTFAVVLRSASLLGLIPVGEEVHGLVLKMGFDCNLIVQTALIDMYCACGFSSYARLVFDRIINKDVICWNTMISGYVKCAEFGRAREVFDEMPTRSVSSWNIMVDMYCECRDIENARRLFDEMPDRDVVSWNAMISAYAKIGQCEDVRWLFDKMPKKNVVSWNLVISCYVHNGRFVEALELFRTMQVSDVMPNEVTVVAVLPACGHLGALDLGQWIHGYISRSQIKMDLYVNTALINMFGKCGSVEEALMVFDSAIEKDTFLYNTMIDVLAMHGKAEAAFGIFENMRGAGIKPNDVTFVGLLKACSHVGLVNNGMKYFKMMTEEYGLIPKVEHFGCIVDLLGRSGYLKEAHELIKHMPMEPHPILLASLLSACRLHKNVRLAEEVALQLVELEPENCGNYVLLSSIYSKAGRWDEAAKLRRMMKDKGIMKKPGCSSIEVNNGVQEFFAGDRDHPQFNEIMEMLDQIS
ncbi:hypothetical protein L1049_011911 [Liquidambar formosana]|uniref:Chlororespiratory reduction 4 n=1 Tax=Liquidambar formosana TaxID=63359 RepID=A0AAP0X061_LIQFO